MVTLTKELITKEDLTRGVGTVVQSRGGQDMTLNLVNVAFYYPTLAAAVADTSTVVGDVVAINRDGAEALWDVRVANPATVNGFNVVAGVDVNFELRLGGTIDPRSFGVSPTIANCSPAWQALLDNTAVTDVKFAGRGTYTFLTETVCLHDITIVGNAGVVIDCTSTVFGGTWWTEFRGSLEVAPTISVPAVRGDNSIALISDPSLVIGDKIIIERTDPGSWSAFNPDYRAGEFCVVTAVETSVVFVSRKLYDDYPMDTIVHKLNPVVVHISDLTIKGNTVNNLINFMYCADSTITNIRSTHNYVTCICLMASYNIRVSHVALHNNGESIGATPVNNTTGILVRSCQSVVVQDGVSYGRGHGITTRSDKTFVGKVPSRDIRVVNMALGSLDIAAKFDGHTENSSFLNCDISGLVQLGGKDTSVVLCEVANYLNGSGCVNIVEALEGSFNVTDCKLTSTQFSPLLGLVTAEVTENTAGRVDILVTGGTLRNSDLSPMPQVVACNNNGSLQVLNVKVQDVAIEVDNLDSVLRMTRSGGAAVSNFIIVDDITVTDTTPVDLVAHVGNHYINLPHRLQSQSGSDSIMTDEIESFAEASTTLLKLRYPRTPHASVTRVGNPAPFSLGLTVSCQRDGSSIRPAVSNGSGIPFGQLFTVDLDWTVGMNEC